MDCNWVSGVQDIIWTLVLAGFTVVLGVVFLRDAL
jgi:hypothetical protein